MWGGGLCAFEIMTSYCTLAVHNHVHVLRLLTVLCDACTLQCLKSKFFVLCSMMGENASRGGSLMRYK